MKRSEDSTLLEVFQSQEKMEEYLSEFKDKPSSINPIIWQVHLSAPVKKRMPVLDRFFQQLLKKYSLVFSFLPDHMVLAKVYKILNIPFNVNPSKTSTVDLVSCKKSKIARSNRYAKIYNSWRKNENNSKLGIYDYNEERPGSFIPYAEFRKECQNKKSNNVSAADILSQLSKSKTKEKLVSDFASYRTQFSIKNCGRQTDSRIGARDADQFARKQTKTNSKTAECNRPKKQTLPRESSFKIFKSKYRPRLDVQLKSKNSDATSSAHPTAGDENVPCDSFLKTADSREHRSLSTSKSKGDTVLVSKTNIEKRNTSYGSLLKILNPPRPCSRSTSSKNEDTTVLASRMEIENRQQSREIQIEADVTVEETTVEQNSNKESTSIDLNKFSEEDPNQPCSEESITVIQPTPDENISSLNSSESEVIYSSNRSEVASVECISQHPVSPDPTRLQDVPFAEERNSAAFFGQPNETNFAVSPVCEKSTMSPSSCERLSSEQSKEISAPTTINDFDQLYKRTPLKIVRKKNLMPLKRAKHSDSSSAFDRVRKCENNRTSFEKWKVDAREEKNKVSDSEASITSSKASSSLVHSVICTQRSSESESEEVAETSSAVPSPSSAQRDEPIGSARQPASNIVCSQSRNSTSQQPTSKVVSVSMEKPSLPSNSSTPERSVPEIVSISSSPDKLRSKSRNSTPDQQPVSKIISVSEEMPRSQSRNSSCEQPVSKIVAVSLENPRPQSKNSSEQPVLKIVSAAKENSLSSSKDSPEQSVSKIVIASPEKSHSTKKSTRKKTSSCNSSKAGKQSKAKTDMKRVKKLTDFVAFSVRKRQASFELSESDDQTVGQRKKESPIRCESTRRSKSISSPERHSAGSRKIRKVKKLFNESEDYFSPSTVKEKPSVEVDSSSRRMCESPSSSKNNDRSALEKGSDSDLSPKFQSPARHQSREIKKLLVESEDSILPSPTNEKTSEVDFDAGICDLLSFPKHADLPEIEKSSDSDSSSIILSREFKTLSLASKKSYILFSSQSSKMSPSSTRSVDLLNSQAATVVNSQFSTEITLDQVDQMMEGVIPNESTDSSFRFDLPSQFAFKESPNSENKFNISNFSDILPSSNALETTLAAKEFYAVSSSDEETVRRPHSSSFASEDTTYPASRSTFNINFSSSLHSLEMAPNEDTKDEFSDGKISDSSFSIRKSSVIPKKSRRLLSPNFNDGLPTRRHCFSLPTENKSSRRRKELNQKHIDVVDIDNTSDEDVFRDSAFRSLPTQLKKKSTSLSARKFKHKYCQNKENQIGAKKSQQKFKSIGDSRKSPLSAAAKSRQFSSHEKSQVSSQKSNQFGVISDDDYESDELNTALNDSLTQFNKRKENRDVSESDAESTTSQYFDADIARLLTEYAALNAEQQPLSVSSNLCNTKSTTFMSTLSVKSNSPHSNPKSRASARKSVTSGASNYKDIMWNSYPDSLETALTTPEEKLEEVRNNLREKVNISNSQKLFSSSQKSKSSRENESDSFGFLDWE